MNYIFSNVYRFGSDKEFASVLADIGIKEDDAVVFMNMAVPLAHAMDFFCKYRIFSFHRGNVLKGEQDWFGLSEMLARKKAMPCLAEKLHILKIDVNGEIQDENGVKIGDGNIKDYPDGKIPTTGFIVSKFARENFGGEVVLVNFYGTGDNSTGKWHGHDWIYEEIVLRESYDSVFVEPGGIRRVARQVARARSTTPVSVVVPIYNVAPFLRECLDSLVGQTLAEIEVICVDDGSTDGSGDIAMEYAEKDCRFSVVRQENQGLSAARNKGMSLARGDYVCFLDSDDWLSKDALERLFFAADGMRLDQLMFGAHVVCDDSCSEEQKCKVEMFERRYGVPLRIAGKPMKGIDLMWQLMDAKVFNVSVPMKLFRLSYLKECGLVFPEGQLHEDEYFSPVSLAHAGRAMAIDERFYNRRLRGGSITSSPDLLQRRLLSGLAISKMLKEYAEVHFDAGSKEMAAFLSRSTINKNLALDIVGEIPLESLDESDMVRIIEAYASLCSEQKQTIARLREVEKEVLRIKNSESYRLGCFLLWPMRMLKKLVSRG